MAPYETLYAIFYSSTLFTSSFSHLMNKVNHYIQNKPHHCPRVNLLLWRRHQGAKQYEKGKREREKVLPHTQEICFTVCFKQTVGINNMLFDSKSYWSPLPFFAFSPLTTKSSHTDFASERSFSSQFKDASLALTKLCLENITLKSILIPLTEMKHYVGVEWSSRSGFWKMTVRYEVSVSVAQRETSGWTTLQSTQTQLRAKDSIRVTDTLQNKRHHLHWFLTPFAL